MVTLTRIIQETATWIHKVNSNFERDYFRSSELKPKSCIDYHDMKKEEFYKVIEKRSLYLKNNNIKLLTEKEIKTLGKLIWSDPETSVQDGGAEDYSQGLYDINECPPWDTWISRNNDYKEFNHLDENSIISWLPNQHFNKFHSGKSVSLLDNMDWIYKLNTHNSFVETIIGTPLNLVFEEKPIEWYSSKRLEINNNKWL